MEKVNVQQFDFHTMVENEQRRDYIQNTILDAVIFSEFLNCLNDVELIYLSLNKSLTTAMIKQLLKKSLDNVSINLLKNRRCPLTQIDTFLARNDKVFNIAIAHNQSLSNTQYHRLFHLMDLDVNISLAFNPSCPKEIIKELSLLHNTMINQALCSNPNTPLEVLQQFLYDNNLKSCLTQNSAFKSFTRGI